jgi:hypothetical protein
MLKMTPLDCKKMQLERAEARPVAKGKRAVKNSGRPGANGQDAERLQSCLDLVRRPVAQPPATAS